MKKIKKYVFVLSLFLFLSQPMYAWRLFGSEFVENEFRASAPEDDPSGVIYGTRNYYFLGICYKSEPAERHYTITVGD